MPLIVVRSMILLGGLFPLCGSALAAGALSLPYQSVKASGWAFAAAVADDSDASAVFFNPAGLGFLSGNNLSLGAHLLALDYQAAAQARFNPEQSNAGAPITGREAGSMLTPGMTPEFYYAWPVSERGSAGFAFNAPLGYWQRYPKDWVGRHFAVNTFFAASNLTFSMGWRVSERWSIGGGLALQNAFLNISSSIDVGTAIEAGFAEQCPRMIAGSSPALLSQIPGVGSGASAQDICAGLAPSGLGGRFDFYNSLNGDDAGLGWNLGLMWQPDADTHVGLHYRAPVRHRLTGALRPQRESDAVYADRLQTEPSAQNLRTFLDARNAVVGDGQTYDSLIVLPALQASVRQHFALELMTPETWSLAANRQFSPSWNAALAAEWTRWRRWDSFVLSYSDPPQFFDDLLQLTDAEKVDRRGAPVSGIHFSNALRMSAGAEFRAAPAWVWRGGYAYEQSVTTDRTRKAWEPDNVRHYYATGFSRKLESGVWIDGTLGMTRVTDAAVHEIDRTAGSLNELDVQFSATRIYSIGLAFRRAF